MGFFSFLGALSPVQMIVDHFCARLFQGAKAIGQDHQGNIYFTAPARKGYNHQRRWVMYHGEAEATRVPAEWHGWLHHQTDRIPDASHVSFRRLWQKPHQPNLTFTQSAHRPKGHMLHKNPIDYTTQHVESWTPDSLKD
jgi:NADH:ubiquinone oxidoreductase subunit